MKTLEGLRPARETKLLAPEKHVRPGALTAGERDGPPSVPVIRHEFVKDGKSYLNHGHTNPWDTCKPCNEFRRAMQELHGISEQEQKRYD